MTDYEALLAAADFIGQDDASLDSDDASFIAAALRGIAIALPGNPTATVARLIERLRTFEESDALGNGDFRVCEDAANALAALAAMPSTVSVATFNELCDASEALLFRCELYLGKSTAGYTDDAIMLRAGNALAKARGEQVPVEEA